MNRYVFNTLLSICFLCCFTATSHAQKVLYECPDLHDKEKRKIEPLTQGFDGWFFRRNDLKMDFSISPQTQSYFKRFNQTLKDRDIDLIILPLLSRAFLAKKMINPDDRVQSTHNTDIAEISYKNLVKSLRGAGVSTLNFFDAFEPYRKNDPYTYNFKHDIHWKPLGAEIFAKVTADALIKHPKYNDIKAGNVVTRKQTQVARSGTITEELQRLCPDDDIVAEPYDLYVSERVEEQKDASSLFGDADEKPSIALVGTSFTARKEFNFHGYLEQYSKRSTTNLAIAGGGMFTSLISYLSSPYFQNNIPPIIIWETQAVYNFNKATEFNFRQVIPAVYGPCSGENILKEKTIKIDGDKSYTLLDGLEALEVHGYDYYLHLNTDSIGFTSFTLEIEYNDGDGELFPIDHSNRYNNKGHFFVELTDKITSNLSYVTMRDVGNSRASISLKLCKKPNT